jgi:two-component sensor histidine kinase
MRPSSDLTAFTEELVARYRDCSTSREIGDVTLETVFEYIDADVLFHATKGSNGLEVIAARPQAVRPNSKLLSAVSLPAQVISQGRPCLIDDLADSRRAQPESSTDSPSSEYRSIAAVPYGKTSVLVAGCLAPNALSDADLAVLEQAATLESFAEDLLGARETAIADDEFVEQTASILSHDAKNFLQIIHAQLDLARVESSEDTFDSIDRAADRLEELIDDSVSLLRHGARKGEIGCVELETASKQAWTNLDSREGALKIQELPRIEANQSSLIELLENIFQNSLEHGGEDVTVTVGGLENGFYIQDTGPGISIDSDDSIFEPGVSSSSNGDGLGLSIVKTIVDTHGWTTTHRPADGGGVRFEFHDVTTIRS